MYRSYSFNSKTIIGLVLLSLFFTANVSGQNTKHAENQSDVIKGIKWKINPFDHNVFVENKGQFDKDINTSDKVIYEANIGKAKAYFTSNGVIYRYDEHAEIKARNQSNVIVHYTPVEWENTSPNVVIQAEQEQSNYYTYPNGETNLIKASIFKKIVYKNLYPGIDVEYFFPKDREGIKYNIIVHPGADLSKVKLRYKDSKTAYIDKSGNVVINTAIGEITDHALVSYYGDGGNVNVSYRVNGSEESFAATSYNKENTLIIDPWPTTPVFSGSYDEAYDVDYDNSGNVYAYGSYNPFQLVKINSAGVIQWTYNASTISGTTYGDFVVDKSTGSSYIVEGLDATGAKILRIPTNYSGSGPAASTFVGSANMLEMWRVVMNPCTDQLIIGAGDNNNITQACTIDTAFTTLNCFNVLGAAKAGHTMVFTALDPSDDTCYMATAKSAAIDPANFNNVLVKMPLPALLPATYPVPVPDNYKFVELASINYVGTGISTANGMNGLSVSPNWLYTSDGATLQKINKINGSVVGSVAISGTSFSWGGITTDMCDNVFVGNQSAVDIYNSSLTPLGSIIIPGAGVVVYAIALQNTKKLLYAAGNGFVTAMSAGTTLTATTSTTPAECGCNGTARITLSTCSNIDTTGLSYQWSNGQTTRTATGLCAGQYTVNVLEGCSVIFQDTVTISSHFINVNNPSPIICFGGSGVSLTASGGTGYTWRQATGLSSTNSATVTATPITTTTYTLAGTNGTGCSDSIIVKVTVNPTPTIVVSAPAIPVCPNTPVTLTASGATTYLWTPASGLNCNTCSTVVSTINSSGSTPTYIVTGTTAGCSSSATVSYQIYTVPIVTVTTIPTSCDSFNGQATVTVSGSEPYTYSWSPKGGTGVSATGLAAGTYIVTVGDTNGCKTSAAGIVGITASPTVIASSDSATCDSTNGVAIATVKGGTAPYKYVWEPGGNTNSTDTHLGAGIYTVTVKDKNGCKDSSFTIIQDTGLKAPVSLVNNVSCFGGNNGGATVTITSGGTGPFGYSWKPLGGNTASVNNLTALQCTVTVTDVKGCKVIDTITISQPKQLVGSIGSINILPTSCFAGSNGAMSVIASGGVAPYNYSWSTAPPQTNDTAVGLAAGIYTVTITDANSCGATAYDTVKQPTQIMAIADSVSATCGNNGAVTVIVTGGTPVYTYNWSNSVGNVGNAVTVYSLSKGTYTVIITDSHGCKDSASTTIDTIGKTAVIKASNNVLCNGANTGSATVNVPGSDTALYSYQWSPTGGINATGVGLTAGIYTITVKYLGNGCKDSTFDTITQPPALSSKIKDTTECNNIVNAYDSTWGGVMPYTYIWSPSGGTNANAVLPSGSYTLTVTDSNKCTEIVPFVAPLTSPTPNFIAVPDTVIPGDSIKFVNLSTGIIAWYWWTFGDGGNSADTNPYHIYNYGGTYVVYLKVGNSSGCIDSVAENIYVKEGITAPNVFTPNGDGINDVFHVNAVGLTNYKIDIYDRWGLLMFEGVGPDNDWTGRTMAGEEVPTGTYYYVITAGDAKGKPFNTKGFLTLIR